MRPLRGFDECWVPCAARVPGWYYDSRMPPGSSPWVRRYWWHYSPPWEFGPRGNGCCEQVGWELNENGLVTLSGDVLALFLVWLVIAAIYAFAWSRPRRSWRALFRGSLLALLGMAGLAQLAFLVVGRTLSNPVYGALAVAAALLVAAVLCLRHPHVLRLLDRRLRRLHPR